MSLLLTPDKVLFFSSFLYRSDLYEISHIEKIWNLKFENSISFVHPFFPMKDYYSREMGPSEFLNRIIFVTTDLSDRENLVSLKLWSDTTEKSNVLGEGCRSINFDVGYISLENTVLATGKSFSHRIHLNSGVYAELTYHYEDKTFKIFPWTYPDYSHVDFIDFFNFSRSLLQKKLLRNNA
jgi:hypothetical protein